MNKQKLEEQLNNLYEMAVSNFISRSDFDIADYISLEEYEKYCELHIKVYGYCHVCGEDLEDCDHFNKDEFKNLIEKNTR